MSQNKERFKQDIERAERHILVVSWIGTVTAFVLIGFALRGLI
jgi:hypothetical protein